MLETIFLIALLVGLTWSAWFDTLWIGGVALALFSAATWLFGDPAKFAFLADPVTLAAIVVVSLGIGALWSFWKWRRRVKSSYVQDLIRQGRSSYDANVERRKARFGESYNAKTATAYIDSTDFPYAATPSKNKDRIMTWIVFWPFSMLVYFFDDFLRDIALWIYERLAKVYQRITLSAIPEDLK